MGGRLSALLGNRAPALRSCALAAALVALASCGAGHAPERAGNPSAAPRVVSLNPCIDAALVEVAAPGQILALSHYSRDPASSSIAPALAAQYRTTGGTVEEVFALDPDVVLASSFIAPATRAAFERFGIKVETFGSPATVAQSVAQIRRVASIAGRPVEGEWLVRDIAQASLPIAGAHPVSTLLWQPGEIVPGKATLVAEMLRAKGFANHAEAMGLSQADYVALETVLADPPEVLLVAGDSAGQRHPLLAKLEHTRVESIDPHLLYCGGRTIVGLGMRLDQIRAEVQR